MNEVLIIKKEFNDSWEQFEMKINRNIRELEEEMDNVVKDVSFVNYEEYLVAIIKYQRL